ncbi:MAG: HDOD domain-containing protein [Spartobacteria bacterium]|nr:HDOD domain-containing protein [Spartobacteria bacterium]
MSNSSVEMKLRVERCLKRGKQLGVLMGVAERIRELTSNANASIQELVHVIEADAVLTLRVLRVVNSAAFGCQQHISNIDQAVVLLGFKQLRELCVGLQVIQGFGVREVETHFDRNALWRHSLGTAVVAKLIEEELHGRSDPALFVAGLLSNVGRVVLDQFFPEEFCAALNSVKEEGLRLLDAERRHVRATHAQVGCWAAQTWGLDETLATMIRDHHGPGGNPRVDVINLAYLMTQAMGFGSPGEDLITPMIPSCLNRLGIEAAQLKRLLILSEHAFEKLEPMVDSLLE